MRQIGCGVVLGVLVTSAVPAFAQEADSPAPYAGVIATGAVPEPARAASSEARSQSRVMEEIVVTAQKREENLQDVPISISAFSGDSLEARGVDDAKSLELVTPGLAYSSQTGYSIIYMRGVGTDVFVPSADTSVATYIDGVYLPFSHGLATSFTKLERIEVLKGPQGTLFGRNTTGGAINIITKKPQNSFEGSVEAAAGNFNARNVKGFVSGPLLLDGLSGSASFVYDATDSYYHLIEASPIQQLPRDQTRGYNLRLRWQAADTVSMMLSGIRTRFDGIGTAITTQDDPKPILAALGPAPQGNYQASINEPAALKSNNDLIYGEFLWQPQALDIKLLASHQKVDSFTDYDYDSTELPVSYFTPSNQFALVTTAELQLSSKNGGWLSDALQWTTGFYYFKSSAGFDPVLFGAGGTYRNPALGLTIPPGVDSILTQLPIPLGAQLSLRGIVATEAWAEYAQGTWRPYDWFGATLGGRYQIEDRGLTKSSSKVANADGSETPTPFGDGFGNFQLQSTTTRNFSPKLTLDFHPLSDGPMLYTSWQKGFKSGTYNTVAILKQPDYVKPEKVTAIEAGIKGEVAGGTLRYSAAVFQNKIDNLQTLIVSLQSGGAVSLVNAARATIKGAEFDLLWQVFPDALPGFVLTAGGAYLDGHYDSFPDGSGYDPATGLFFGPDSLTLMPARDFSGNRTVRTPKFSGTLGPTQTFTVPGGAIELGGDLSYNSGYFYDTQNTVRQPRYVIINARASYLYDALNLRVTAFAKNLGNEVYYYQRFVNDFGTNSSIAPPRTYGLRLAWEF